MNLNAELRRVRFGRSALLLILFIWLAIWPPPASSQTGLVVIITHPANGATVSGPVIVHAAVQYGGTISGVQFQLDGVNLGPEITSSPYRMTWETTTTTNGSHTLTAIARDALGMRYTSDPVVVTVSNDLTPPTVTITSPASGANVTGTIPVSADASDNVGVVGVQFRLDGANLGAEDTSAPYSIDWITSTAGAGPHTLRAVARDAANNTAFSEVTVVIDDTTAPAVSITSPSSDATVAGTTTVEANASDNLGVVGVQFLVDGANLGAEDTTAPYSTSWDTRTAANGGHTLTAVARDAAGNTTTSAAVGVTVSNDLTPPSVSITAPGSGSTVSGTTNVSADASDNVGVAGVRFMLNGANLGAEDTSAPYSVSWDTRGSSNGNHTLTAVARDAAGNVSTPSAVTVTVSNDVTPPSVSITSPNSGKTVWETITVSGDASDNVAVAGVQFQVDGAPIGQEGATAPYSVAWNTRTTTNGSHTLTAVARDAAGNTAISSVVTVNVANSSVGASGDVFVGLFDGQVQWHAPNGTLRKVLVGVSNGESSGLAFDANGILYVPHWFSRTIPFNGNLVTRFDIDGELLGTWGSGYNCNPSSLAFDSSGNVYVGQEGCAADILKFDTAGNLLTSFDAQTGVRGPDHIDLAADGCTIYYSNWGRDVLRYNVCTNTQLPRFNTQTLPGETAWHLRILPDGGVLVPDSEVIVRLDASGNQVRTYFLDEPNANWWVGVAPLPDGTFWAISTINGEAVRFDLQTGAVLGRFNAIPASFNAVGIAVKP